MGKRTHAVAGDQVGNQRLQCFVQLLQLDQGGWSVGPQGKCLAFVPSRAV